MEYETSMNFWGLEQVLTFGVQSKPSRWGHGARSDLWGWCVVQDNYGDLALDKALRSAQVQWPCCPPAVSYTHLTLPTICSV
eukprot:524297-Rhodomonas_salina.2